MTGVPEPKESVVLTEDERVEVWRLHELIDAGYPVAIAELLAHNFAVDLHAAVAMLAHGCSAETAKEILL